MVSAKLLIREEADVEEEVATSRGAGHRQRDSKKRQVDLNKKSSNQVPKRKDRARHDTMDITACGDQVYDVMEVPSYDSVVNKTRCRSKGASKSRHGSRISGGPSQSPTSACRSRSKSGRTTDELEHGADEDAETIAALQRRRAAREARERALSESCQLELLQKEADAALAAVKENDFDAVLEGWEII